jgi:hypothetical protein
MKVWNYMMIMLTMMIFLAFVGLPVSGGDTVLSLVGVSINSTNGILENGDVSNSDWFNLLFNESTGLIVLAGLGTAIIVGFFTRQFDWRLVLIGFFTSFVIKFASVGWGIITLAKDTGETWLVGIVATIFIPLTVMFIFSIVEWFGGTE